ncbi:MAG: sterol desaturase family protein [Rhizobiaceae bacterium]|nr:sterol desaturase family protein [Rhizobiaceae bacterium]
MVDETQYGERDRRGHWRPFKAIEYPPIVTWPMKPLAALKWFAGFPGYLFPWNTFYFAVGLAVWYFATPSMETMKTLSWDWVAFIFVRNMALVIAYYSIWHFWLYIKRAQDTQFKFNANWPSNDNSAFLFKSQNIDNVIWSLASGIPICTAWEVGFYWFMSNGYLPVMTYADSPIYFWVMLLLIPVFRDIHFHWIHRLLHVGPLYGWFHSIHHNNVNPGPWSGLSMHPVEHLIYFSNVLMYVVVPFHPAHAVNMFVHTLIAPATGHSGFDEIVVDGDRVIDIEQYQHYLHHKYHEVNYSHGVIPFDRWLGSEHDGTPESHERMMKRFKERAARQNAKAEARATQET